MLPKVLLCLFAAILSAGLKASAAINVPAWFELTKLADVASVDLATNSKSLEKGFDYVNDYLIDNTKTEDVEESMRVAKQSLTGAHRGWLNDWQILAMRLFVAMSVVDLSPEVKCLAVGANIIALNERAAGRERRLLAAKDRTCLRQVDLVINHYSQKFVSECSLEPYLESYSTKQDQFVLFSELADQYDKYTMQVQDAGISQFVANVLAKLAKDDPDARFLSIQPNRRSGRIEIIPKKYKSLFEKYLLQPCKSIVSKVETKNVFVPVDFVRTHSAKPEAALKRNAAFEKALLGFKLCTIVDKEADQILEKAMQYADKQA